MREGKGRKDIKEEERQWRTGLAELGKKIKKRKNKEIKKRDKGDGG